MSLPRESSYTLDGGHYELGSEVSLYSPDYVKLLTLTFTKEGWMVKVAPTVTILLRSDNNVSQ